MKKMTAFHRTGFIAAPYLQYRWRRGGEEGGSLLCCNWPGCTITRASTITLLLDLATLNTDKGCCNVKELHFVTLKLAIIIYRPSPTVICRWIFQRSLDCFIM